MNKSLDAAISLIRQVASLLYVCFLLKQFLAPDQPLLVLPVFAFSSIGLVYLWKPLTINDQQHWFTQMFDLICFALCVYIVTHYIFSTDRLQTRIEGVDPVMFGDLFAFGVGIPIMLEAVRRSGGMGLVSVLLLFLSYGFLGGHLPGWFYFSGFSINDFVEFTVLGTEGVFGVCTSAMVTFVFYFIFFGAAFSATGGGQIFIDLALALTGRLTGGAAKTAIVSSALFGTISGSALANVTSTGVLTIPLMKSSGYTPEQAGAVEAIASTGGQLMPPIMGVAAFVMADLLGIPYSEVAMAGVLPSLAFYIALFINVDLIARKRGIGGFDYKATMANMAPVRPRLHLLAGPIVLVLCLMCGYSASMSAMVGTVASLICPLLRVHTRYELKRFYTIFMDIARQMADVAVPVASVGIIIAVAIQSGLAIKFVALLAQMGSGNLYLSLLLVILGCLVLGLGLPTVAAYIISAVMFVPALTDLGLPRLAAHFFVMYYSVLSMVTPPVALAAFAASAIAKANPYKTGFTAFNIGFVIFILPFGFVNDTALLWQGPLPHIALAAFGIVCGTGAWAVALQGYLGGLLSMPVRIAFGVISFAIVFDPTLGLWWNIAMCGFTGLCLWRFMAHRAQSRAALGGTQ